MNRLFSQALGHLFQTFTHKIIDSPAFGPAWDAQVFSGRKNMD